MVCGLYGWKFGRDAREAEPKTKIDKDFRGPILRQLKARGGNEQIGVP